VVLAVGHRESKVGGEGNMVEKWIFYWRTQSPFFIVSALFRREKILKKVGNALG
jgi:hypothetical protein